MSAFFLEHPKETDLALFAGGESGPFARWRIERHVESCPRCQDIAADFFRLPDQLNELADLPSVDWKQMAMAIESGVRADAAVGRPARRYRFLPPLAWQAGLVAATVVVGVGVVWQASQPQPEPELIAAAQIEASVAQVEELQGIVEAEPTRSEVAAAAPQSKAVEARQTFASDIAAPAAPPLPPPTELNEADARRQVSGSAQPAAADAESAEVRLRNDAAARVGAVSAIGGEAPAALEQAGAFRQARVAWAQLPVEAVNFEDAPVSLSSGYTAFAGATAKTPAVSATNRTDRMISGFELVWIVGDASGSATARIRRQGISLAPGAVATTSDDRSWQLPADIVSTKMRIYVSTVSFEDGTAWTPAPRELPIGTAQSAREMQPLPVLNERDGRP